MNNYVIYFVYKSKPQYLQRTYEKSWCIVKAILQFKARMKPNMLYVGCAKIPKVKEKK